MKKFTLIFAGFLCIVAFLNAQNNNVKTYFNDHFVGGLADDGDIIWVGVDNNVVKMDKIYGVALISYTIPISNEYEYTDRHASSISLDNSGLLWITSPSGVGGYGLEGNYIVTFSGEKGWLEIPWPDLYYANLTIDKEDKVWVSEILGLHVYNGFNWIDYITRSAEWPYNLTAFTIDNQNNKWLGLAKIGYYLWPAVLAKFEAMSYTVFTSPFLDGSGSTIWSMDVSSLGTVWMGTEGNGLVKFDGTNWEVYNWSNSGLPNNSVRNVTAEGANLIWMSTPSGLTRFDGVTWRTFNTGNSMLPSNTINSILIDENGTKWVGTDKGLISFPGSSLSILDVDKTGIELQLYPNPANDFIILKTPMDLLDSTIEIYNILGKDVKSIKMDNKHYEIDIRDLAIGMYFVRLQTKEGMVIKKFVKLN